MKDKVLHIFIIIFLLSEIGLLFIKTEKQEDEIKILNYQVKYYDTFLKGSQQKKYWRTDKDFQKWKEFVRYTAERECGR